MEKKITLDETALEKFDPTVAQLTGMVEKTKGLTVADLKDKAQLETVRKARIELKKTRVSIEKYGKDLRDEANKWSKSVIAKEKELIAIISPEEDRLALIEGDAEKLAIREDRVARLPDRKQRIKDMGLDFFHAKTDEQMLELDANGFEAYINELGATKVQYDKDMAQKERDDAARVLKEDNDKKEAELKKREDDARAKEDENAKEEARLKAEKEAREREEKARREERDRLAREEQDRKDREKHEKEEADRKAAEDRARLEKADAYKKFRTGLGWTKKTEKDFKEENTGAEVVLWKKVGTFKL